MRLIGIAFVVAVAAAPAVAVGAESAAHRFTRCCLELGIPEVPGPVCAQVRGRRRLRPALACRLLGGMPKGRGDCSLALCRPPA
jgi:hypothetical protein